MKKIFSALLLMLIIAALCSCSPSGKGSLSNEEVRSFFKSVISGDMEKAQHLAEKRPELVNATDGAGETALHVAAMENRPQMVTFLLSKGAKADRVNNFGYSPLHVAVMSKNTEIATILLDNGASANLAEGAGEGSTVDPKFMQKRRPLHFAARNDDGAMTKLLIHRGASFDGRAGDGSTALHTAVFGGNEKTAQTLLQLGADANAEDAGGQTPLHYAAAAGSVPCVVLLLKHGATRDRTDSGGRTPLNLARLNNHPQVAAILQK